MDGNLGGNSLPRSYVATVDAYSHGLSAGNWREVQKKTNGSSRAIELIPLPASGDDNLTIQAY
jgi:hypothetical protein